MLHLEDQIVVAVDVETTGLAAHFGDRVCEVGIVKAHGDAILDTYQTLVNPRRPISPGARRVNGLSDEMLRGAPTFAEVADQVLSRIDEALLVCHNAPFDLGFLDAEFSRLAQPWQPGGVIDTLEIARRHFNFSSNSLPALAGRLGIEVVEAHRALGDALTTLEVFRIFSRQLNGRGLQTEEIMVERHSPESSPGDSALLPADIQDALENKKALAITYIDAKGEETQRVISPVRVQLFDGLVYLVAYCHMRQAERNFRLDRIYSIGRIE